MDLLKLQVILTGSTLVAIVGFGYKVIRFINRIEFRTDLMWADYQNRMNHNHNHDDSDK